MTDEKKTPKPVALNEVETAIYNTDALVAFQTGVDENIPSAARDRMIARAAHIAMLSQRLAIKAARARKRANPKVKAPVEA